MLLHSCIRCQLSFTLECREAHLWYILPDEVKSTNLLNRYLEILSPCEKENISRMSGEQLKKRALLARALVRTTLARCKFTILLQTFLVFLRPFSFHLCNIVPISTNHQAIPVCIGKYYANPQSIHQFNNVWYLIILLVAILWITPRDIHMESTTLCDP